MREDEECHESKPHFRPKGTQKGKRGRGRQRGNEGERRNTVVFPSITSISLSSQYKKVIFVPGIQCNIGKKLTNSNDKKLPSLFFRLMILFARGDACTEHTC